MQSEEGAEVPGRRLHPLTLVFATAGIARSMLWPAVVGGVGIGGRLEAAVPIFLAVLAVPALIGAAVKYACFRWWLTADELVLQSGLLNRRNRVIPFARVQNVDVRQGPLQRIAGVAELRVETAGAGQEAEAVLAVLGVAEAQGARAELLARRRRAADASLPAEEQAATPLARLSTGDVLLAGATANEAGVIAAALAGLLQFADELPFQAVEEAAEQVVARTQGAVLVSVVAVVLGFLLLGWLISIGGALLRYHGFTLERAGGELRKRYGLLTLHEGSVPLERVQAVRVEEPVLRRALRCASLQIETAGGAPGQRGGAEAFVPLARREEVGRLVRGVFADAEVDGVAFTPVHPRARRRMAVRGLLAVLVLWMPFWVARALELHPAGDAAPWLAVLLPVPWLMARWQYRHRGWALVPGYLLARTGAMNRVTWIVPDRKLQTLHLLTSPFQRRYGLATLVVDTAAGGRQAEIVDLAEPVARELLETLRDRARAGQPPLTAMLPPRDSPSSSPPSAGGS
jgi:putative membrane protein